MWNERSSQRRESGLSRIVDVAAIEYRVTPAHRVFVTWKSIGHMKDSKFKQSQRAKGSFRPE